MPLAWPLSPIDEPVASEVVTYFLQAGDDGPIKVGRTQWATLHSRIATLQCGCPQHLHLRSLIIGDWEAAWHAILGGRRLRGEWFALGEDLAPVVHCSVPIPRLSAGGNPL